MAAGIDDIPFLNETVAFADARMRLVPECRDRDVGWLLAFCDGLALPNCTVQREPEGHRLTLDGTIW